MRKQLRLQKLQSVRGGVQTLLREITLSKKLKESIESQLALEAATRLRLNSYKNELTQLLSVFEAVDRNILLPHIPALVPLVAKGLHLPLPAILCQQLWKIMSRAALQEFSTGKVMLAVMEAVLLCSYSPHPPHLSHTTSSPPTSTVSPTLSSIPSTISPTLPSSHPLPTSLTRPTPTLPTSPHLPHTTLIPTHLHCLVWDPLKALWFAEVSIQVLGVKEGILPSLVDLLELLQKHTYPSQSHYEVAQAMLLPFFHALLFRRPQLSTTSLVISILTSEGNSRFLLKVFPCYHFLFLSLAF